MSLKIIDLDERFSTGEPTVQPVLLWGPTGRPCYERVSKEASHSPALDYIKTVEPIPGHTVSLILGLGSYEFYGLNRNGDGFNERPYKVGCSNGPGRDAWVLEDECIQHHYKTYENGHVFLHHANKDPKKAVGKVLKAFWNPYMHRVEVLESLDNKRAPHIAEQIADGEYPAKSMGTRIPFDVCFVKGTLVRTYEGYTPIEDVTQGMRVLTHTGRYREVTKTMVNPATQLVTVAPVGAPATRVTPQHPYYVLREQMVRSCPGSADNKKLRCRPDATGTCPRCNKAVDWTPEWVSAEDLRPGDYLLRPLRALDAHTPQHNGKAPPPLSHARALGYYLGDGCITWNPHAKAPSARLYVTAHAENTVHIAQVQRVLDAISPTTSKTYPAGASRNAVQIVLNNTAFCQWAEHHAGRGSRGKRLHEDVYSWPLEHKRALVGGYIDTDGCVDSKVRIATVNRGLALDVQRLVQDCGVLATVTPAGTSTGYSPGTQVYYVTWPTWHSEGFTPHSVKLEALGPGTPSTPPRRVQAHSLFWKGYWCTPVRAVTHEALPHEVPVYNISVDEDESYVVEGVAVHNCTVCGNRAPTRKQYCDHLKFEMTRLRPDGLKVGALNPSPRFFDSSWVIRPADRTAYMLKKVAEHADRPYALWSSFDKGALVEDLQAKAAAARKLAVIDKVVKGYPALSRDDASVCPEHDLVRQFKDTVLPSIVERSTSLDDKDIEQLTPHGLTSALGGMFEQNMQLSTPEFLRLFFKKTCPRFKPPGRLLDVMTGLQGNIFQLFGEQPTLIEESISVFQNGQPTQSVRRIIRPLSEKHGSVGSYLGKKLTPNVLRDSQRAPTTEMLEVEDPETGQMYRTTRGAATRAQDSVDEHELTKIVGSGALAAAAYKLLSMHPTTRPFSIPLGAGTGYAGYKAVEDVGRKTPYTTTSGEEVPHLTEFVSKTGALARTVTALGRDYELSKTGSATLRRAQVFASPAAQRLLQKHANGASGFAPLIEQYKVAADGLVGETISFAAVAEFLGAVSLGRTAK